MSANIPAADRFPPTFDRFSRPEAWGELTARAEIQEQVGQFLHMIPEGTETVLDVGCGDGAITNELAKSFAVTGVDTSAAALEHVQAPTIQADATALPFGDRSFDLVVCSEMLEHLEKPAYRRAVSELTRVADSHLLISVPYREQLGLRELRCPRCGWRGHVWGHRQSFTVDSLLHDLSGFQPLDLRIFGALQRPAPPGWLLWISHNVFGAFWTVSHAQLPLCESCGNTDFTATRPLRAPFWWISRLAGRVTARPWLPFWLSVLLKRD